MAGNTSLTAPPPVDPLDFSSQYNTPIPASKQADFNKWVQDQTTKTGRNPLGDRYDYDVNGYWLSGGGTDSRGHGTDQFKKPNHPTFSNESQYHGLNGYVGGKWVQVNGKSSYLPSQTNLQFRSQPQLQQYFNKTEPDVTLLPPVPVPTPSGSHGNLTLQDLMSYGQKVDSYK